MQFRFFFPSDIATDCIIEPQKFWFFFPLVKIAEVVDRLLSLHFLQIIYLIIDFDYLLYESNLY